MAIRGGKKLPDKRGFVDGPGGYRGRDDRDPSFGNNSNASGGIGGQSPGPGAGGQMTFGATPNSTTGNAMGGTTATGNNQVTNTGNDGITNVVMGAGSPVTFGGIDPRTVAPSYNPDLMNNFFSGIGGGISNLASNFNVGNVIGSVLGNMIAPGIGGILGGYIGNTYGDDDTSNNFFGNLGENLKTDFGDTVDFFSSGVKDIDPSLDTSGLTNADLTGSEIINTAPIGTVQTSPLTGFDLGDFDLSDVDNPKYGMDDLQRMAGGNTYGAIGSSPVSSVEQDDTSNPMSYGDLNIYQSGPVQGLTLTNEQDQLNKEGMEKLIGEVIDKYSGTKNFFQDPNSTFRNITPGVVRDIYNVSDPDAIGYRDVEQAIAEMEAKGEDSYTTGYYAPGYNVFGDPSLSYRDLAGAGPDEESDAFATGYTDQSARNMLYGPQEKPVFDYGNTISVLNNPNNPYRMAQTALEEAFHYDSANSPMPNKKGESYDFDTGEETMIKEMLGTPNSFEHLAELGYRQDAIGRPSLSELSTEQDQQDFAQFLDQFGFTQRPTNDTYTDIPSFYGFNQGGRVPPMSGPMSNGIGTLYKQK